MPRATLIQSGWIDWSTLSNTGNLGSITNQYYIFVSQSQNVNVGRDGTITGASIYIDSPTKVAALGFGVLRATGGANEYDIIGKSEEPVPPIMHILL